MFYIDEKLKVPKQELQFTYARSQGPGGQNVNKVNSKATMRWCVVKNQSLPAAVRARFIQRYRHRLTTEGDLLIVSQRYRDRGRNVTDCFERLRKLVLAVATPPKPRKKTAPTKGSKVRRRKMKEQNSQKKQQRRPPRID